MERHLVVFLRAPRLGRAKRRLARDVGLVAAWRFHRLSAARLLRRLARPGGAVPCGRWRCWLAVTPDREAAALAGRAGAPWRTLPQGPGDLGDRMARVLRRLPPGPVVIVGADIPDLTAAHVARAFRRLGDHGWVIGPAEDGGYWLIGARRRPHLRLPFAGVRWGGPHALADTLAGLAGARVARLEVLADVDRGADLARVARRAARA
ncbi:MAG: TIGR04282 family arsenosugar biosynthesis glycosyltransferase [Kiloniellales bacterium]|nr:TIGR04282 family arsenosugar biosynthesis glycosyltransferase [Kiloniellales bacterium]